MEEKDERPIVALGSLPPHVDGPVMGYVKVRIKVRADGPWLVRVRWWGAMAMHEKGDLLREGQTLAFPVHVSRDHFARYLADMGPLRLDVVDKATHQVVGRAEVPLSLAEMETPGLEKETPIVRKSTFQVRGVLHLSATLLWGEDDSPIPMTSTVTVRRNRDLVLPPRLVPVQGSSSRTPSTGNSDMYEHVYEKDKYDQQAARREPLPVSTRLDALVKKGEALKKAMQQAMNTPIEPNVATQRDVATVLATAKSLGPDDAPSYSWRALVDQYTKDDTFFLRALASPRRPAIVPVPLSAIARAPNPSPRLDLECVLYVSYVDGLVLSHGRSSLHFSAKMPWSPTVTSTQKNVCGSRVHHRYVTLCARGPVDELHMAAVRTKTVVRVYMVAAGMMLTQVLEVWQQAQATTLMGLAKLPLHGVGEFFESDTGSVLDIVFDGNAPIVNLFDAAIVGHVACQLAVGSSLQIDAWLERSRSAVRLQSFYRGWRVRKHHRPMPPQPLSLADKETAARVLQRALRSWRSRAPEPAPNDWAWESLTFADNTTPAKSRPALDVAPTDNSDHVAVKAPPSADVSEPRSALNDDVLELLDAIEGDGLDGIASNDKNPHIVFPDTTLNEEEVAPSVSFLDDTDVAIALLNPKTQLPLDKSHGVAPSVPTSCDDEAFHHSLPDTGAMYHKWTLSLREPFGGSKASGLGCELRYTFDDAPCSMWWDATNASWSSVNEHVGRSSSVALDLELWWQPSMTSVLRCIGRAHVVLDAAVLPDAVPIQWDLTHFQARVPVLPLRVVHSLEASEPSAGATLETKSTSSKLLPATSMLTVRVGSFQLASASVASVQVQCALCVGDVIHDDAAAVAFDAEKGKWMSRQLSPLLAPTSQYTFQENVTIHAALLDSMSVDDVVLDVWHVASGKDLAYLGAVAIPLASLLFRTQGIDGVFPLLRDGVYHGRAQVHIAFNHGNGRGLAPTTTSATVLTPAPVPRPRAVEMTRQDPLPHPTPAIVTDDSIPFSKPMVVQAEPRELDETHLENDVVVSILQARHLDVQGHDATSLMASIQVEWGTLRQTTKQVSVTTALAFDFSCGANFDREREAPLVFALWLHEASSFESPRRLGQAVVDLALLKWTPEVCGWYHIVDATQQYRGQLQLRIQKTTLERVETIVVPVPNAAVPADIETDSWRLLQKVQRDLADIDQRLNYVTIASPEEALPQRSSPAPPSVAPSQSSLVSPEPSPTASPLASPSTSPRGLLRTSPPTLDTAEDEHVVSVHWSDSESEFDMTALDVHTNGIDDMLDDVEAVEAAGDMNSKTALVDDEGLDNNDATMPDAQADSSEGCSDDVDLSALSVFAPPAIDARQDDVFDDEYITLSRPVVHEVSSTPAASEDEDDDYEALAVLLAPPIESAPASPVVDLDFCMWSGGSHPASERSHAIGDDVLKTVLETMQDIKFQLATLTSLSTPSCSACASPVKPSPPLLVEHASPVPVVERVQLDPTEQPDLMEQPDAGTAGTTLAELEKTTTVPCDRAPHDATTNVPASMQEQVAADNLQPSKERVCIETTGPTEAEPTPKRPPSSSPDSLQTKVVAPETPVSPKPRADSTATSVSKDDYTPQSPTLSIADQLSRLVQRLDEPLPRLPARRASEDLAAEIARLTQSSQETAPNVPVDAPAAVAHGPPRRSTARPVPLEIPPVFRTAKPLRRSPAKPPVLDSETERIAKIMRGSLSDWLEDDSSDDDDIFSTPGPR